MSIRTVPDPEATTGTTPRTVRQSSLAGRLSDIADPARQAFLILWVGFSLAPVLFGADKFAHALTDWDRYLAPSIADIFPWSAHTSMLIVGVVEIVAGALVFLKPRYGAYVVALWLAGIIVNLVILGGHYDVALRDFGLLLGALALARLAARYDAGRPVDLQ